jgi:AcrR family transcriptional regulator
MFILFIIPTERRVAMPKVSDEHREARRDQILEAALSCFSRKGYHDTSMHDIAKEAGLSTGAAYIHFRGKEEILEACFKKNQEIRNIRYENVLSASSGADVFRSLGEYFTDKIGRPVPDPTWQLWMQVISEAPRNPRIGDTIREGWKQFEDHVGGIHEARIKRKAAQSNGVDPRVAARLVAAVHDGLVLQRIIDPDVDVKKCVEWFGELVDGAYAGGNSDHEDKRR